MTTFYLDEIDPEWRLVAEHGPWRLEEWKHLRRLSFRYGHADRDHQRVAVVANYAKTKCIYPFDTLEAALKKEFWKLAAMLPGEGYQMVFKAMPMKEHPEEMT